MESISSEKKKDERSSSEAKIAKKVIETVLLQHNLEVRDIEISPDGKFLISCSECEEDEDPYLIVWNIDELLEGETKPEVKLISEKRENKFTKITNWLLCSDSAVVELGDTKWWVVCAGSIIGDIYIWNFRLAPDSKKWDFKDYKKTIIAEGSKMEEHPKAIFDIKILRDPNQNNLFHIYYALNNIHTIFQDKTFDNTFNEIKVSIDESGIISKSGNSEILGTQDVWFTKVAINKDLNKNLFVTGSKDGNVYLWNISTKESTLIGEHDGAITDISIIEDGNRIATSSHDMKITIWERTYENKYKKKKDLLGHTEAVLSIDVQNDDKYLMSAAKDNTIKIWDLDELTWIRSVDMSYYLTKYEELNKNIEKKVKVLGINFLRNIKITPDNRYVFVSKYDKIIILRNFGGVWHFNEQLKFVKENDHDLYEKIYGANLRQIARYTPENLESLGELYEIVKKRLIKTRKVELAGKTERIDYNMRELGTFFIPSFMSFEKNLTSQKEFILGIKQNYEAYWNSIRNSIFKLPDIPWGIKLYVTTSEMEEKIEDSNFVEITSKTKEPAYIIMDDRTQTQIRFLMVLDKVPSNFIPLINNINIDVEDDRGDKDNLAFSDFTYSKNFIKVLTNPKKSLDKSKQLTQTDDMYFADCTFQIDEGYCTDDFANIFIRKITVEYTETLEPSESSTSDEEDFMIFEAFRKNFLYPLTPKTQIQIGKGFKSKAGKMIDEYFAKIIIIEFLLSFWGFIEVGLPSIVPGLEMPDIVSNLVNVASIGLILLIFIMMIIQSRSGKKSELDMEEFDRKMRKRRRKKFGK
jgi:WD40 repeat protein